MTILNHTSAAEYVRQWHANGGETIEVVSVADVPADVYGADYPAVSVVVNRQSRDAAQWHVWVEGGELYGEW